MIPLSRRSEICDMADSTADVSEEAASPKDTASRLTMLSMDVEFKPSCAARTGQARMDKADRMVNSLTCVASMLMRRTCSCLNLYDHAAPLDGLFASPLQESLPAAGLAERLVSRSTPGHTSHRKNIGPPGGISQQHLEQHHLFPGAKRPLMSPDVEEQSSLRSPANQSC